MKLHVANPADKHSVGSSGGAFVFTFGGLGWDGTWVLAYGTDVCSALEEAAEWLAEHRPGHFVEPEYPSAYEPQELQEDLAAEAEAGLTHTESGWLESWNWTYTGPHTVSGVRALVREVQS